MPTIHMTKRAVDALKAANKDTVYWDAGLPGFGVKVTPRSRKVFVVLYRIGGAGSRLRKYTIGPYGRVTLQMSRREAQKVLAARLEGRDPATEKRESKRRMTADRVSSRSSLFSMSQRLVRLPRFRACCVVRWSPAGVTDVSTPSASERSLSLRVRLRSAEPR